VTKWSKTSKDRSEPQVSSCTMLTRLIPLHRKNHRAGRCRFASAAPIARLTCIGTESKSVARKSAGSMPHSSGNHVYSALAATDPDGSDRHAGARTALLRRTAAGPFQRNPLGRGRLAVFLSGGRRTRSLRIDLDMLVVSASPARTALKNSQLIRPQPDETEGI
jgi:hypothetical protein